MQRVFFVVYLFTKLNISLQYDPVIALFGIYQKERKTDVCTKPTRGSPVAALMPMLARSTSVDEWLNNVSYFPTTEL